jgi:hypothetical protein
LEFARARLSAQPGNFRSVPEIVFGAGPSERVLEGNNFAHFERLIRSIGEVRHAEGPGESRWWRLHPERWLESLVVKNICALDDQLDPRWCYSQVPAFSASDRAMIDVLVLNREGRLAVVELKADEDIHLPLQAVDYWSRVVSHHARGEFQKFGYFAGRELSPQKPLLIMVAPALHVHPATDTLLRLRLTGNRLGIAGNGRAMEKRSESGIQETSGKGAAQDRGLAQNHWGISHYEAQRSFSRGAATYASPARQCRGAEHDKPSPARDGIDRSFPNSQQSPHVNQLPEVM